MSTMQRWPRQGSLVDVGLSGELGAFADRIILIFGATSHRSEDVIGTTDPEVRMKVGSFQVIVRSRRANHSPINHRSMGQHSQSETIF